MPIGGGHGRGPERNPASSTIDWNIRETGNLQDDEGLVAILIQKIIRRFPFIATALSIKQPEDQTENPDKEKAE